ncbi:MAG: hypothetical protein M3P70_10165 [Actinomycetota bacterium]|nr:hypothetical protein [Actinomycetota bacterium]
MRAMSVMRFAVLGVVGFGFGWAGVGFLNTVFTVVLAPLLPPHSPLPLVGQLPYLAWFFAGALGGTALGVALATIRINLGRLIVPLVVLVVALGFSHLLYPCSPDERAVLTEFPQYAGKEVTDADEGLNRSPNPPIEWIRWVVGPHPVRGWGCGIGYYEPTGTREERIAYYRQRLEERGWEVGRLRSERGGGGICCKSFYAYRDGYRYWVYADSPRRSGPATEGYLLVEVTRVGLPRPGWFSVIA